MSNRTWEGDAFREALAGRDAAHIMVTGVRDEADGSYVLIGIDDTIVKTMSRESLRKLIDAIERAAQFLWGPEDVT